MGDEGDVPHHLLRSLCADGPRSVLVVGEGSCGKTAALSAACRTAGRELVPLDITALYQEKLGTSRPIPDVGDGVLLIRHIDVLCPAQSPAADPLVTLQVVRMIEGSHHPAPRLIAATARRMEHIDPAVLDTFDEVLEMRGGPLWTDRMEVVQTHVKCDASTQAWMVGKLGGYTRGDVEVIVDDTVALSKTKGSLRDAFATALSASTARRGETPLAEVPSVRADEIVGHAEVKEALFDVVRFDNETTRRGGILLYGVPGTGKTMLAKAAATEVGATFLFASIPSLVKGHVGESEEAVRRLFRAARTHAPSIVFLDEVQAMFGDREDAAGGGHDSRAVSQLLLEMDDRPFDVAVIAATNVPWELDPALLAPGRLDTHLHVRPPSHADRTAFLKAKGCHEDLDGVGRSTSGYSYADMATLWNVAVLSTPDGQPVNTQALMQAVGITHPSCTPQMLRTLEEWRQR